MDTNFGRFIRGQREKAGFKLNEFARRLEISPAYWSRIENGRELPPKDELITKAAALLNTPIDDLFIEAQRLPPDMQPKVDVLVAMYRGKITKRKSTRRSLKSRATRDRFGVAGFG